ncbi:nucleolar preribosomal assembly protein, putative [Plasmodium gallinaceum]|uniref:Ribosome production factor 2 homolog n=1 Tax=Plasmodium gallinaceum TaxID=5849 RepID=A0A1J1GYI1_PLAGA|nr:nucleolar preribosomal assembly protein, putative [Plasmodium gallinaceum]CRG97297.1 nucleolar preribosomal assembly protein, putative [Plasmodium gallinaceum]
MENENKEEIIDEIQAKAKTRKGNVILKKREGELNEDSKYCLFISGNKRTELLKNFMQDIYSLHKPLTCYMPKLHQNLSNVLDKIDKLVELCVHNNCSFFFLIFSTKKKPSRFLLGRLYNNKILDYYIFSLLSFIPIHIFPLSKEILYDTKPIVLIQGSYFEKNETTKYLKNVLFDFFKHKNIESFSKNSIQRLIVITAYESKKNINNSNKNNNENKYILSFRQYLLKKEFFDLKEKYTLNEIGPQFEFILENCKIPDFNIFQEALKKPQIPKKRKSDKIKVDEFGNNIKKVYIQKQNFSKLHTKHTKVLKKGNYNKK